MLYFRKLAKDRVSTGYVIYSGDTSYNVDSFHLVNYKNVGDIIAFWRLIEGWWCSAAYVQEIGFDPTDVDWQLIGFDWAKPRDKDAWQRLYKKWKHNRESLATK